MRKFGFSRAAVNIADFGFRPMSAAPPFTPMEATGGTIVDFDGNRYHIFTASDDFTIIALNDSSGDITGYLNGGGGGGGAAGGGGGGIADFNLTLGVGVHPVLIGAGGVKAGGLFGPLGTDGGDTWFNSTELAHGGGRGAIFSDTLSERTGGDGGCGGGGAMNLAGTIQGNGGIGNQGQNGGKSATGNPYQCGGGGGTLDAGQDGGTGSKGGDAYPKPSGSDVDFRPGAGGGGRTLGGSLGGLTGGGTGGNSTGAPPINGGNATAPAGGGGGAGSGAGTGGDGEDGLCVIWYSLVA